MTTITAKIIADSIGEDSKRLTTMQLRYPRAIHAEFMTHRVFSRNASSSRAIPVERLIKDVMDDPFIPLHWGKNQKGMQADEECDNRVDVYPHEDYSREDAWWVAIDSAVETAKGFAAAGYHKQLVNRLLEPFAHINVVVTSTEWSNFFVLRDHPDAEPHIRLLAQAMKKAMSENKPMFLEEGQWHLPYVVESTQYTPSERIQLSVARCARVSYMTHDGRKPDFDEDIMLGKRLLGSVPLHASPAEHQAQCKLLSNRSYRVKEQGNFGIGWVQYRKTLKDECQ